MSPTSAPPQTVPVPDSTAPGATAPGATVPEGLFTEHVDTPVGRLLLVAGPRGLRAVLWPDEDGSRVRRALASPIPTAGDPVSATGDQTAATSHPTSAARSQLDRATAQLREYFEGSRTDFDLELDPVGTPFQLRVWEALRTIPYGRTRTYAEQAQAIGSPAASRAVGAADGRNPLSIVVPCHRVVGATGRLTGFAGGVSVKAWLLEHEQSVLHAQRG